MKSPKEWMQLAFLEALKAKGNTFPNPAVGCVVVKNNKLLSKGFTQKYGSHHAEVSALNAVGKCTEATLYVTLEPCCHYGKTPPCVDLIIQKKIAKVFISSLDPFKEVSGRGVEKLKANGIDVSIGVLQEQIDLFYQDYFHYVKTGLPLVILKIAESADSFITQKLGSQTPITGKEAKLWVHQLRNRMDAILVGGNTVRIDNPLLTPYLVEKKMQTKTDALIWTQGKQKLSLLLQVFSSNRYGDTKIFTAQKLNFSKKVIQVKLPKEVTKEVFQEITNQPYHSILVEGGAWMINQWLKSDFWNLFYILTSTQKLQSGLAWNTDREAQAILQKNSNIVIAKFSTDEIKEIKNKKTK